MDGARPGAGANPAPDRPLVYRPVNRPEVHAALRIILGSHGRPATDEQVLEFVQFTVQRNVDLNDLWVAERAGRVVWAVLPMVSPGRTMLLIVPGGRPRGGESREDVPGALVDAACEHFASRGVRMAQVLLDPPDAAGRDTFRQRTFREMAELLYLQADVRRAVPAPQLPDGFDWIHYAPAAHGTFAATIIESYRDSLDCPGLNGLRDIEDVITGHKAAGGAFDPAWWFVLRERGRPMAVLLLARAGNLDTAELVYLGLVPAARGRGLADVVMRQALHTVAASGVASLALAVDAHNVPALRLYHRHGLRKIGSKIALMRELRATPADAPTTTTSVPASNPT